MLSLCVDGAAADVAAAISIMDCTLCECLDFGIRLYIHNFNTMSPCINVHRMIYVIRKGSICLLFSTIVKYFSEHAMAAAALLPYYAENDFNVGMKQRNTSKKWDDGIEDDSSVQNERNTTHSKKSTMGKTNSSNSKINKMIRNQQ